MEVFFQLHILLAYSCLKNLNLPTELINSALLVLYDLGQILHLFFEFRSLK